MHVKERKDLAILVIPASIYCSITKTYEMLPYIVLCLGVCMLVIGLEELQKNRKSIAYMSIIVAIFVFIVSIQNFIIN